MFIVRKPNYALLGRRESYSIRNQQAKKDAIFEEALTAIKHYINSPNFVSIPDLVTAIYCDNDPQLEPIREALKSNSLFQFTTCLSASGQKILAYLAVLHDKNCLAENGDINLDHTKQIIRGFFTDETNGTIQFDDSTIRNLKSEFPVKDNIDIFHHTAQAHINAQEWTPRLFQAFKLKDLTAAQEALRNGADVNGLDENCETPLMWAAYNGWLDMAQVLFAQSSAITCNAVNNWGSTALLYACQDLTDIPFLTQLLARSSDKTVSVVNKKGHSAFSLACQKLTDIPFLTQLLARSSGEAVNAVKGGHRSALFIACEKFKDIPFLTQLLARSSDEVVNEINHWGGTVLLLACQNLKDIPFLTQLLARSSDKTVNSSYRWGGTALWSAFQNLRDIPFLTQLLERSSDETINTVQWGRTVLMLACQNLTDITFIEQILKRSSYEAINTAHKWGETALLALVSYPAKLQSALHLIPLFLPHINWKNFCIIYDFTGKTAWQLAHGRGKGPWSDIAIRIGEAMLMECAQRQIPWGKTHHKSAIQKKRLTQEEQTPATVCEDILKQMEIPADILGIIRNYNESPFSTPKEALNAINDFLKRHLQQKEHHQKDSSQLFDSVDDFMLALHDTNSLLNLSLVEYAATHPPKPVSDAST